MRTSDFDFLLPPELIAQAPLELRDHSRLMVVDAMNKKIYHQHFYDIVDHLTSGDLLVWNTSKVFRARLRAEVVLDVASDGVDDRQEERLHVTGTILNAPVLEIFLVRPMENKYVWKVLAKPGRKLRLGMKLRFAPDFEAEVLFKENDGTVLLQFAEDDLAVRAKANLYGEVPLPPYISKEKGEVKNEKNVIAERNADRYQTVYAKQEGSVAAPTAGFHFTPELIEKLKNKGVEFAEITLHVGLGTFLPVKSEEVENHTMHAEEVELTAKNADLINRAKAEGRRIVSVGTTTVRTLEGIALRLGETRSRSEVVLPYSGDINIFITPGFKFRVVDALITNFHLPKSTLLMLVSAFAQDQDFILSCYRQAVEEKYRFYSFGDAMFIC